MDFEGETMTCFAPSAHFTASFMKHGREANILHSSLLSNILLCTLLLIVNLRSYDTKVRLTRPHCRVIEFGCAIFEDPPPPPPPSRRRCGDVHVKACRSEGRSLVSHSSVLSEQSEQIQGVGPMKYSARYSQAGCQDKERCIFVSFLFYQPFIPGKSTEHWCSSSAVPSFPFIQTKRSHLLLFAEQLHWSSWGIEGAIIKVFPALSAGFMGMLINMDDSTITSLCV